MNAFQFNRPLPPNRFKETVLSENQRMGYTRDQGRRPTEEDAIAIGTVSPKIAKIFFNMPPKTRQKVLENTLRKAEEISLIVEHEEMTKRLENPNLTEEAKERLKKSGVGSTAVIALIAKDEFYYITCGDSDINIVTKKGCERLNPRHNPTPHNPDLPHEFSDTAKRAKKHNKPPPHIARGGIPRLGSGQGGLSMSHGLGNKYYRQHGYSSEGFYGSRKIRPGEYILINCDGLFENDCLTPRDVKNIFDNRGDKNPSEISQELVNGALPVSGDNIAAVVAMPAVAAMPLVALPPVVDLADEITEELQFAALFDGNGGHQVANAVAEAIPRIIEEQIVFINNNPEIDTSGSLSTIEGASQSASFESKNSFPSQPVGITNEPPPVALLTSTSQTEANKSPQAESSSSLPAPTCSPTPPYSETKAGSFPVEEAQDPWAFGSPPLTEAPKILPKGNLFPTTYQPTTPTEITPFMQNDSSAEERPSLLSRRRRRNAMASSNDKTRSAGSSSGAAPSHSPDVTFWASTSTETHRTTPDSIAKKTSAQPSPPPGGYPAEGSERYSPSQGAAQSESLPEAQDQWGFGPPSPLADPTPSIAPKGLQSRGDQTDQAVPSAAGSPHTLFWEKKAKSAAKGKAKRGRDEPDNQSDASKVARNNEGQTPGRLVDHEASDNKTSTTSSTVNEAQNPLRRTFQPG